MLGKKTISVDEFKATTETEEPALDPTLVQLMIGEIRQYLDTLEPYVVTAESGSPEPASIEQVRAAHSLAGSLELAPLGDEAELAKGLERYLESRAWSGQLPGAEEARLLRSSLDRFSERLAILEQKADAESFAESDESLISQFAGPL